MRSPPVTAERRYIPNGRSGTSAAKTVQTAQSMYGNKAAAAVTQAFQARDIL